MSSRSEQNLRRARQYGATWAGNAAKQEIPAGLDAAIVFPPAGALVEPALRRVKPGGVVALAPVAMSRIEIHDHATHFWGRDLRTLYNVNRRDSEEFLGLAREIDLSFGTEVFPFPALQEGMIRVKRGEIQGANAVVRISEVGDGRHHEHK